MTKNIDQKTNSDRIIFLIVCLLTVTALFMRVKYIEQTVIYKPVRADARQYVAYGYNVYTHGIFSQEISPKPTPDSYRSPGYPLFISLAFLTSGTKGFYPFVLYSQTIFSTLLVPLTFLIGIRFLSSAWAIFAALLVAFSPHLISMTSYLLTETLFSFILLSASYSFCFALQKKKLQYFILAGLLVGFAYLTNETALFLPFLFAVSSYFFHKERGRKKTKKILINISIYLIFFSLFPLGWAWRNHNLDSEALQGSSRAVGTMSHGAYPDFIYKNKDFQYFPYREDPMQPAFGSNLKNFSKILFERFKERPVRYLSWYFLEKPYYVWSWNILQGQGDIYVYPVKTSFYHIHPIANISREVMKYLHTIILLASFIGILIFLYIKKKNRKENVLFLPDALFIIIIYYTALYTVFAPWPRYSVPLRPELYLFAIWSLNMLITYCNKKCLLFNNISASSSES